MKHVEYNTQDVCSKKIIFDIDDEGKIRNLTFIGGCNGNLKAIGKLCEGKDASEIATLLQSNFTKQIKRGLCKCIDLIFHFTFLLFVVLLYKLQRFRHLHYFFLLIQ